MSTGDNHLGKPGIGYVELQPGYQSDANRSIISIDATLDQINVQLTRIADALTQATPAVEDEGPEEMVDVHGNPIPADKHASIIEYLERAHQSGIAVTSALLCQNFSESPATMQHIIDDYYRQSEESSCNHSRRKTVGTMTVCSDCGAVGGNDVRQKPVTMPTDWRSTAPEEMQASMAMEDGDGDAEQKCRHLGKRKRNGTQLECCECGEVIGDLRTVVPDCEEFLALQLEQSEQRCRDLEESVVRLNKRIAKSESAEHRNALGDDDGE